MNLKELIFGKGASSGGEGGVYRDSIQAWLPIKNIIGGVVITKDDRFVKILELLPVNVYLKSANDWQKPRRMWSGCAASRSRRKTRIAVR